MCIQKFIGITILSLVTFACNAKDSVQVEYNDVSVDTSPPQINQADIALDTVNSFEKLFGVNNGKRRNHTKGFCFTAELVPVDEAIKTFTTSSLFTGTSKVVGRFSHKGGKLLASDNKPAEYGMGLAITTHTGEQQLMSMNTLDFFPVATPEAFTQLMRAKAAGGDAVKKFKAGNTDLQRFKAHEATKDKTLTPYEGSTYNSINSFYLLNDSSEKTAIRWSFVPKKSQAVVQEPKQDFFFENMQSNLAKGELIWDMQITLANDDDQINNAALAWEGEHTQILAAQLRVLTVSREEEGHCETINYDPMVLANGFEPSADPLLQARRNTYAIAFGRRLSEKNTTK